MSERIAVRGIRAYGKHGARAGERDFAQPFDVDVELEADLAAARAGDDLSDTLDYALIYARVAAIVRERSYRLLERLADEIVRDLLSDARVLGVRLTIAKPGLLEGATPSVTVCAERTA